MHAQAAQMLAMCIAPTTQKSDCQGQGRTYRLPLLVERLHPRANGVQVLDTDDTPCLPALVPGRILGRSTTLQVY